MPAADHFYTTSQSECDNAFALLNYISEGVACYVFATEQLNTGPLFRLFNPATGDHFYTTSTMERDAAVGYVPEGIACYVYEFPAPGTTALFRLVNPNTGDHFYTISQFEVDSAVAAYGYIAEGTTCFVFSSQDPGTIPLFRMVLVDAHKSNPIPTPWAVLVCKYNDDPNDPYTTRLSDLYQQWLTQNGALWIEGNAAPSIRTDTRTFIQLYTMFFTNAGFGTYNAVKYWDDMSHGATDISGSQIFTLTLSISAADALAKNTSLLAQFAAKEAGQLYWDYLFQQAKSDCASQYDIDLDGFYAVAMSFQSSDGGGQGGKYDGTRGTNLDIRYVMNNGMSAWGQEMGHAFGMGHSRQQGSNVDYLDKWDAMSTYSPYALTADPNYGRRGIGVNAWNMRGRRWLDESRIWKPSAVGDFSQVIQIRPLHSRNLPGYLGAELPGIGNHSPYLIEFRMQEIWDAGIPDATIMVHRFSGDEEDGVVYGPNLIDQFLHTHSYLMQGTNGQLSLSAGDVFEIGNGPYSRMHVLSIDAGNKVATIQLCYSKFPKPIPKVTIHLSRPVGISCAQSFVEGSVCKFIFKLESGMCRPDYKVLWFVAGASAVAGQQNNGPSFSITAPDPSILVTVAVGVTLDDGVIVTDTYSFHSISQEEADLRYMVCRMRGSEQLRPIPWWEWDKEKMQRVLAGYSRKELVGVEKQLQKILQTFRRMIDKPE